MIERFHTINVAGTQIWVSNEVRKEFEHWFRSLDMPHDRYAFYMIEDIYGAEVFVVAEALNFIYESTPEIRAASHKHDRYLKSESSEVPGVD